MAAVQAVTSVSPTWQGKLQNKKYRNWIKVNHALSITCIGVRPYIEKTVKTFHANVLARLAAFPLCTCVHVPRRKPDPWHDLNTCYWAFELAGHHSKRKPTWSQSDSTKWADPNVGYWEVAKLYMPNLGRNAGACIDVSSTDATGILNLICWCDAFNINQMLVEKVRETRNTCCHSAQQELDEAHTTDALTAMKDFLQDPELLGDHPAQEALLQVTNLECDDMIGFEEIELKVVKDLISSTNEQIADKIQQISKLQITLGKQSMEESSQIHAEIIDLKDQLICLSEILNSKNTKDETNDTVNMGSVDLAKVKFIFLTVVSLVARWVKGMPKGFLLMLFLLTAVGILEDDTMDSGCSITSSDEATVMKQFDFSDYLRSTKEGFIGRQWLFDRIITSLEQPNKGVIITGAPGSGKSSVIANLICTKLSSVSIHSQILAYHMCIHSFKNTQDGAKFVRNLVHMIASKIPEYRNMVMNNAFTQRFLTEECDNDPTGCFEQTVVIPLRRLNDLPRKSMLVLIDALDECFDTKQNEGGVVDILSKTLSRLPKWVKVVLTSRNDSSILREFPQVNILEIREDDPNNLRYIEVYISRVLNQQSSLFTRSRAYITGNDELPATSLVKQSEGNFLYIKLILEHISSHGIDNVDSLDKLPRSIASVYRSYFKREDSFKEDYRSVRRIFEVLVATFRPLTAVELFEVLQIKDNDLDYEYDFLYILNTLSTFLRYGGKDDFVRIFHSSLYEWLTSDAIKGERFYVSGKKGHQALADFYLNKINKNNTELDVKFSYRLANHISKGGHLKRHIKEFSDARSELINRTDPQTNLTSLHYAAADQNADVIELLLSHFIKVDCHDIEGRTPAFIAASAGQLDNIRALLDRGANVYVITKLLNSDVQKQSLDPVKECKRKMCGYSLLHAAAEKGHSEVVMFLLKKNLSVSEVSGAGNTAMQIAAEHGHVSIMGTLLKYGAAADVVSLRAAAGGNHVEAVQFLLHQGVTDSCLKCDNSFHPTDYLKQPFGQLVDDRSVLRCETALHIATMLNFPDVIDVLLEWSRSALDCPDYAGMLPLHEAVRHNIFTSAERLLIGGANVSLRCSNINARYPNTTSDHVYSEPCCCGFTALHLAARYGHSKMAELLIKYGALTTKWDSNGQQPLHVAACHGQAGVLSLLVSNGVDINSKDTLGMTALHHAVDCNATSVIDLLFRLGSDIKAIDNLGRSTLNYVISSSEYPGSPFLDPYVRNPIDVVQTHTKDNVERFLQNRSPWLASSLRLIKSYLKSAINASSLPNVFKIRKSRTFLFRIGRHIASSIRRLSCVLLGSDKLMSIPAPVMFATTALHTLDIDAYLSSLIKEHIPKENQDQREPRGIVLFGKKTTPLTLPWLNTTLNCSFLLEVIKSNYVYTAIKLLDLGMDVNCDDQGETPLLAYLRTGGRNMVKVLVKHNVAVGIKCGEYFMDSAYHLSAYHKFHYLQYLDVFENRTKWDEYVENDNALFDYLLYEYDMKIIGGRMKTVRVGDGPLTIAIKSHPLGYKVIEECFDEEGFSALHRTAQGANVVTVKQFLDWGADASQETIYGKETPLFLSIAYAIKYRPYINFHEPSVLTSLEIEFASYTAKEIILHLWRQGKTININCDSKSNTPTLYHLAASRGMYNVLYLLIEKAQKNTNMVTAMTADCPTKHGITPLYLAKLVGIGDCRVRCSPWNLTIVVIENYGGTADYYPDHKAEYFLLLNTLFNAFPRRVMVSLELYGYNELRRYTGQLKCKLHRTRLKLGKTLCQDYCKKVSYSDSCHLSRKFIAECYLIVLSKDRNVSSYFTNTSTFLLTELLHVKIILFELLSTTSEGHCVKAKLWYNYNTTNNTDNRLGSIPDICSSETEKEFADIEMESKKRYKEFASAFASLMEELESLKRVVQLFGDAANFPDLTYEFHSLQKQYEHCMWRNVTLDYIRLRFLLMNLNFWQQQVQKNKVLPSLSDFMMSRMKRVVLDLTDGELIDVVTALSERNPSKDFAYLELLRFPRAPMWKETFPS